MRRRRQDSPATVLSKKLSWALRHGITELGLKMSVSGYVQLSQLLRTRQFQGTSSEEIKSVIENTSKKRFSLLEENGTLYIRAIQGHSVKPTPELVQLTSPVENVYFGGDRSLLPCLPSKGICRMQKNYIELSFNIPNAPLVIEINLALALSEGVIFYVKDNLVLTQGVHGFLTHRYFKQVSIDGAPINITNRALDLDYILVVDFEANATNKGKLECQEIIEFPVCVVNVKSRSIERYFHYYVKPVVVPVLTQFIIDLTGITQDLVENALVLEEVLVLFEQFLKDSGVKDKNWVFLSCGDWDLKTCLPKELDYKRLDRAEYFWYWINIKNFIPQKPKGMIECLEALGIPHAGRHHSGIDDTENIAKCTIALLEAGVDICEEDIVCPFHNATLLPAYRHANNESHTETPDFDSLVVISFEEVSGIIVAAYVCLFSLSEKTVISYHNKLIRPAVDIEFDIERTLIITEQIYNERAVSFAEFEDYLKNLIYTNTLKKPTIACLYDKPCKELIRNTTGKTPSGIFRSWINLYKFFTNQEHDTDNNLKLLLGRQVPLQSQTDSKSEFELKTLMHHVTGVLTSHPRIFQCSDLSYFN